MGPGSIGTSVDRTPLEGESPEWRPLRLSLLSYGLPVPGQKRGGIERVAHDLAEGLSQRGHSVTVWSYDPRPANATYEVRPLPHGDFVHTWLGRRLTMGYLGNLLTALPGYRDSDAVISLGDSLLLPLLGRPVVRVMCGSALGEALSATSPWRFTLQLGVYVQELLSAATQPLTIGISENTRRHNPFVRRVVPIGVDLSAFTPDAAARATEPTILFVGTLTGRKRGSLLLDWFEQYVRPRHSDSRLIVVGPRGPELPGVSYATGISLEELALLYRRAWVYASPSQYEGFGLPYLEAMASGTPVIATANPGSREVLAEGTYGVLATDDEFSSVLNDLLSDPAKREELARRGLERATTYTLERMVDRYEEILLEAAGRSARPPSVRGSA